MLGAERELSLHDAEQVARNAFKALNIDYSIKTFGNNLKTVLVTCQKTFLNSFEVGWGKGYQQEATVGALFEALEHCIHDHYYDQSQLSMESSHHFCGVTECIGEMPIKILSTLPEDKIICRKYRSLVDDATLTYPLFLTQPGYEQQPLEADSSNYQKVKRYSSNNGTAIGATFNEAVVHALGERIERDAISLFFLKHFYYGNSDKIKVVNFDTASPALKEIWIDATNEIESSITLIDVSTEFAVKTYIAVMDKLFILPFTLMAHGASLNPVHAAKRALTELVQIYYVILKNQASQNYYLKVLNNLSKYKKLMRCFEFNIYPLLKKSAISVDIIPNENIANMPLADYLQCIIKDIQAKNKKPFVSELYSANGVSVVNVLIPGLEHFHSIISGNIVVPSERGRELCSHQKRCNVSEIAV